MESTILIWKPKNGNIGHVSMRVSANLYISLWPRETYDLSKWVMDVPVKSKANCYEHDCRDEGDIRGSKIVLRPPDEEIDVKASLNITKLFHWWKVFQHAGYRKSNNCIDAVRTALKVGEVSTKRLRQLNEKLTSFENEFTALAMIAGIDSIYKKS